MTTGTDKIETADKIEMENQQPKVKIYLTNDRQLSLDEILAQNNRNEIHGTLYFGVGKRTATRWKPYGQNFHTVAELIATLKKLRINLKTKEDEG